jgi:beta-lactam-binding protein with PASTA domain
VRVPVGGRVDLLLSEGPPGGAWLVPDLRGGGLASARELLAGRGLPAPRVRYQSAADRQADTVLDQSPPPGSRLERGRSLELVVASGS